NDVLWSDELFRILGYDPAQDRASTEAFFEAVHPDDRDRVRELSARGIASGVSQQVDYRILRADGSVRHVTMNAAFLFDSNGNLTRAVGTVLDVTNQKRAALELKKTADFLTESQHIAKMGSFEQDVTTGEATWSDELFRLLDIDHTSKPCVELFMERLAADDRERIGHLIQRSMSEGRVERSRAKLVHRDGSIRHVDMDAVAVVDDHGRLQAIRGTVSDVTELVELEARFHQSQKMEAVGQLAGGLAHDYNNLLTVILGNAELLYADSPSPELEEIIRASKTATLVTNRLLTFSRHSNPALQDVRLADEVNEARPLIERALGKQVSVVVDDDARPGFVCVDSGQVHQVLLNLALNARDAMPQGGTFRIATHDRTLTAEAATKFQAQPGPYVTLDVADTGVGMDAATLARIFEPFFTTKEAGQGTGLGLAMVFGAMRQVSGFVEASSEPGAGSLFRLWFPAVPPPLEPGADRTRAAQGALRVLLVEDSEPVLRLALAMLTSAGHHVRAVASGEEALERWREEPADVLVTDVVMPQMSGTSLADELRRHDPLLPVLFITGYLPDRVGLATKSRLSAVVMKPFERRELLTALDELVTSRAAVRA
ncbi:MAG TPA: PAS domain-containing protein, partial [Polyangiaceae bacterium]